MNLVILHDATMQHVFDYLAQGTTVGFLRDGNEKAALWARSRANAAPVQLSRWPGLIETPSDVIVRQRAPR